MERLHERLTLLEDDARSTSSKHRQLVASLGTEEAKAAPMRQRLASAEEGIQTFGAVSTRVGFLEEAMSDRRREIQDLERISAARAKAEAGPNSDGSGPSLKERVGRLESNTADARSVTRLERKIATLERDARARDKTIADLVAAVGALQEYTGMLD